MPASEADKSDLLNDRTRGYRPQTVRPSFLLRGLPPFTLWTAQSMQDDDAVKLGMAIKFAPHMTAKLDADGPEPVRSFVRKTLGSVWVDALPRILNGFWNTRSVGEVLYRRDASTGLIHYAGLRDFAPTDANLLLRNGERYGLRVRQGVKSGPVDLTPPKSFAYIHGREFSGWDGKSELAGAYEPWLEKTDRVGGAKESRRRFMHTRAFHGGIIYYPPGSTPDENGNLIPNLDIARTAMELAMNGAIFSLPNTTDDKGNREWEVIWTQQGEGGAPLIEYVDTLGVEIHRGMGIPDDIVIQVSGTGSYAGRRIPIVAFFKSEQVALNSLVSDIKRQIIDPLVWANFGATDYSVSATVDEAVFGETDDGQRDGDGDGVAGEGKAAVSGGGDRPASQAGQQRPQSGQPAVQFSETGGNCGTGGGGFKAGNSCAKRGRSSAITAYHGTDADFEKFDASKIGTATDAGHLGRGFYFSTDPAVASNRRFIKTVSLDLKNPLELKMSSWNDDKSQIIRGALGLSGDAGPEDIARAAKDQGYDGATLDYSPLGYHHREMVVWSADQIQPSDPNHGKHDKATGRVNGFDFDEPDTDPPALAGDPLKIAKQPPKFGGRAVRSLVRDMIADPDNSDTEQGLAEDLRTGSHELVDFLSNGERVYAKFERWVYDRMDDDGNINGEDADKHVRRMFFAWSPAPEEIAAETFNLAEEMKAERKARVAAKKAAKKTS